MLKNSTNRNPMQVITGLLLAVASAWSPASSQEAAPGLESAAKFSVAGQIAGKKDKAGKDISGMACLPGNVQPRLCLLVNDENTSGQFVRIQGETITPGDTIALIGRKPAAEATGSPPDISCGKSGKFSDFDGEGVAYGAGAFFVAGSHGCSRNSNQFRLSSFYLARIAMKGESAGEVSLTYRLSDVLQAASPAASRFGSPLDPKGNGLNIEGIAIAGGKLWIGLRAPVDDGIAYIVSASLDELFAPGKARWQGKPDVRALPLGAGRGIRDLASLSGGRLLVLSGPAQDQQIDYRLHVYDPAGSSAPVLIGALEKVKAGKAESITVLKENGREIEIAVLFDGVKNGGGRLYRLTLR